MKYRFAEFEIDLGQHELRRRGSPVHAEPQVFDLIVHLVRNHDRVVSKDEVIENIWNGRIISEAAFSSRINGARRVLGDSGTEQQFIKTLHRRGFRFVGDVEEVPSSDADAVKLVPGEAGGPERGPPSTSVHTEISQLDDVVSEAVKAEAITRPSIAVLPFQNISNDPENEYFSYGLTEDIIRLLARNRWLSVISRHSTIGFLGGTVDAREVGAQLGATYVMSGSVRKSDGSVRIAAELARAADGQQLWSEKYEFQLLNIFDIQDEMARQIAATIEPELSKLEQQLAARKPPESLDAWDCYQRGLWNLWRFTTPGFDSAEEYFQRSIAADPTFARGHGALSYVNIQRSLYDAPEARGARLKTALHQAQTAVSLDELDCFCHCALGRALCLTRQNEEASAAIGLSLELNPSFAQGYFAQGFNLLWCGREIEAETLLDQATILSPRDSHLWSFHHTRSWAHFSLGEYDIAAEFARRAARQSNATYRAYATLAASLGRLGDHAQASAAVAELMKRKSGYTTGTAGRELFFCRDPRFLSEYTEGLRSAGVRDD
ncbi:winged helix-turn-helix domain-containing tetratricopeptide repeat protein [Bradyrhizobium sp. WSM1417]|uniref:winged helix-turn-helix domain-containing tetratricopeptide repeat protein n=1 Tax=Bradyrhizobium sp. WSM1417 TaxID=754500 RepID=UPI000482B5C7|nr:winged helix-turn-helix domain-containing protein [Bradyrhizobium sp. WSM1417]